MILKETNHAAPEALALAALAWTLSEEGRARRLLDTTGLTPEALRGGLGDPAVLAALLRFLEAHEPDLVACADQIGVAPAELVNARRRLEA
ncbi:MAG TPA: DUF3572 family protein [Allosphingosinicella sp.]|jgi:hypothetical protein